MADDFVVIIKKNTKMQLAINVIIDAGFTNIILVFIFDVSIFVVCAEFANSCFYFF